MKQKIARIISIVGHPLLTIPLYVLFVMVGYEDIKRAALNSFLIIGCIFIPLALWLFVKSRNGTYTNFDVSDRKQRKSVFVFIIPILCVVTYILYKTGQSSHLWQSMFFALLLVVILQLVNFNIKSSMHVALNIYLAFLVMTVNYKIGIVILLLTGLIGWSRIVLGRHSIKEVVFGAVIGFTVSIFMFYVEVYS